MARVIGIQRRQGRSNQRNADKQDVDWDHEVFCTNFIVERRSSDKEVRVDVLFPHAINTNRCVGISFPSTELALSVGHALLAVAGGGSDKMEGHCK